jgi:hypothetical protein
MQLRELETLAVSVSEDIQHPGIVSLRPNVDYRNASSSFQFGA